MQPLQMILFAVTAGALAVSSHPPTVDTRPSYDPTAKEYYLTEAQQDYIRPGVNITIVAMTDATPGKKPTVEFTLTDDMKQPLDRLGATTPGPVSVSFVYAKWDPKTRYYVPYTFRTRNGVTNPSADQGGTFTDVAVGRYKYTFGTTLPASMDVMATNTLGAYGSRNMTGYLDKNYYAPNVFLENRADGGTLGAVWNAMDVAVTCNNCHDPLALHGGTRRTVKNCMLCHNASIGKDATSGNTFDGKVFFHKLHRGAALPSVIGGTPYIAGGDWSTVGYPQDIRSCDTCHQASAPEGNIWTTRPSRAVCGACHDDVNFATGVGHYGLVQTNDNSCKNCHQSVMEAEWDPSPKGAHTVPSESTQLKGLKATIVSVADLQIGKKPTVTYKITNGDGTVVDGTKLGTFAPILAGPTTDYMVYWRESGLTTGKFNAAAGTTSYTFLNAIPASTPATATLTVSLDAYRNVPLVRGDGKPDMTQRECAVNPVWYGSVADGSPVVPRRTVVNLALCNKCHNGLALHGGQRLVIEECVICHNPTMSDTAQRNAEFNPPESIDMKRMIHRIHTGEELEQEYTVYGNGRSKHNYNEVRYPGDRRNCQACHAAGTYDLPPGGILDTPTPRDYFSPTGPGTTSCLGCHDKKDNASHAFINTARFGEACATCHGPNSDWSPSKAHAR